MLEYFWFLVKRQTIDNLIMIDYTNFKNGLLYFLFIYFFCTVNGSSFRIGFTVKISYCIDTVKNP